MPAPDESPVIEHSMPSPALASAHSAADFFSRALSSFQSSGSKFSVICTATPTSHFGLLDHGQPTPYPPRVPPRTLIVLDSSFNPPTRAHLRMASSAIHDLTHRLGRRLSTMRLLLLLSVNNADKVVKPAAFDKRLAMMWAFARDVQHSLRAEAEPGSGDVEGQEGSEAEALCVDLGLAAAPYFHEKSAALASGDFYRGDCGGTDGVGETEQIFLVGYDTLIRIFNPKYYGPFESASQVAKSEVTPMQEALGPFFGRAKLRVTMRTGDEWGEADDQTAYLQDLLHADGLSKVGGSRVWGSKIETVEGRKAGVDSVSSTYARASAKARDSHRLDLMVTPGVRWWIEREGLYTE